MNPIGQEMLRWAFETFDVSIFLESRNSKNGLNSLFQIPEATDDNFWTLPLRIEMTESVRNVE